MLRFLFDRLLILPVLFHLGQVFLVHGLAHRLEQFDFCGKQVGLDAFGLIITPLVQAANLVKHGFVGVVFGHQRGDRRQHSQECGGYRHQKKLFDDTRCFFYITNDWKKPAEQIVFEANGRCNQENLLAQLKGDVRLAHRAGGQPALELGVHGRRFVGLEPECLGRVDVAGGGALARESP